MILDRDEMMALVAVRNMHRHLASGVTTIRDNGGRNLVVFAVREAIERGYFAGPRLLLSGRPVTHSLGHFHWCNGVADGAEEIVAAVRRLVAEGADHIKIMASGGGTAGTIPSLASYTPAELHVAVEAAHDLGRLTTAHARAKSAIANAIEAGLDCIEHGEFLVPSESDAFDDFGSWAGSMEYDAELGARLVESGLFLSATLQPSHDELVRLRLANDRGQLGAEERQTLADRERYHQMRLEIFSHLIHQGMTPRIALSTDAGPFDVEFGQIVYSLELGVEGGLSPQQAIEASTRVAARACGVEEVTGTLVEGKFADLLVVEGNPLTDMSNLRNVREVYAKGRRVVTDGAIIGEQVASPAPEWAPTTKR
jgi:imidazolonepropionase-like amidohydrolase